MSKFKSNCTTKVRDCYEDICGRQITITGTHGFEWSIAVRHACFFMCITFPNRKGCMEVANSKYKKNRKK